MNEEAVLLRHTRAPLLCEMYGMLEACGTWLASRPTLAMDMLWLAFL